MLGFGPTPGFSSDKSRVIDLSRREDRIIGQSRRVGERTGRGSTRHGVEHATVRQDAGLRAVHRASDQSDAGAHPDDRRPDGLPDARGGGARAPVPGGGARPYGRPAGLAAAAHPARCARRRGGFAIVRVFLPMVRRVNGFYAARAIEETDPAFKNSLINYLDLRRHRDSMSKSALAAIEAKAVHDLTNVEIDSVVNQRRLMQMAYLLSGVFVVFSLYALMTPKSIPDSIKRAFLADVVRPTDTRLTNIKPGDDPELVAGGRRLAGPLLGGHPGDPPPEGLPPLQRRRGLVLRRQGAGPGPELLRPLADDLAQRPAGRRLLPDRGRRRVAPLSPGGPARADGHRRGARIRLPGLYGPGPPGGHRGGARRGDRGDAGHRAAPGPISPRDRGASSSPRPPRPRWRSRRPTRPSWSASSRSPARSRTRSSSRTRAGRPIPSPSSTPSRRCATGRRRRSSSGPSSR